LKKKVVINTIAIVTVVLLLFSGCGGGVRRVNTTKVDVKSNPKDIKNKITENEILKELSDEELLLIAEEEESFQLHSIEEEDFKVLDNYDEVLGEKDPLSDIPTNIEIK
jgi:hypothetical protein